MNFNLGLTFSGLIYTILVLIIYTKRKKIKTFETIVYKNLLVILNLVLLFLSFVNILRSIVLGITVISLFTYCLSSFFNPFPTAISSSASV